MSAISTSGVPKTAPTMKERFETYCQLYAHKISDDQVSHLLIPAARMYNVGRASAVKNCWEEQQTDRTEAFIDEELSRGLPAGLLAAFKELRNTSLPNGGCVCDEDLHAEWKAWVTEKANDKSWALLC